jgi:hypothetical protein
MASSQKEKSSGTLSTSPVLIAIESGQAIIYSSGRRGVRIFSLPSNQQVMVIFCLLFIGFPLFLFAAMVPVWDFVGNVSLIKKFNSYVAPVMDSLPVDYLVDSAWGVSTRRLLIASTSITELIFLSNFVALLWREGRRRALRVWICYDRWKLLQILGISCVVFCGLWYVFFFDWTIIEFLNSSRRGGRIEVYMVLSMPYAAILFGRMATIVGIGTVRLGLQYLRRLSKEGRVCAPP